MKKKQINLQHVDKSGCFTARKLDNGTVQIACVVIMEDPIIHTEGNGYSCNDRTCPCQTHLDEYAEFLRECPMTSSSLDDATMPDDIAMYYVPVEERSYDHPGVPAPCWEDVDGDTDCLVEYPLGQPHRQHEDWQDYL